MCKEVVLQDHVSTSRLQSDGKNIDSAQDTRVCPKAKDARATSPRLAPEGTTTKRRFCDLEPPRMGMRDE